MSDAGGPEWIPVFEGSGLQAEVIRAALDAAGFTVFGMGAETPYPGLAFEQGRVYVPREEAERARGFLRSAGENPVVDG